MMVVVICPVPDGKSSTLFVRHNHVIPRIFLGYIFSFEYIIENNRSLMELRLTRWSACLRDYRVFTLIVSY